MIEVLLVDDSPPERVRLVKRFAGREGRYDLTVAEDFRDAVRLVTRAPMDVAIVDIAQRDCDGFELIRQMKTIRPSLRILVVSARLDASTVVRALAGGASGYLQKGAPEEHVLEAVDRVHAGERYLCPRSAERVAQPDTGAGARFTRAGDGAYGPQGPRAP